MYLNNFSGLGNTYMPKEDLIKECEKVLMVDKELVEENIYNMFRRKNKGRKN